MPMRERDRRGAPVDGKRQPMRMYHHDHQRVQKIRNRRGRSCGRTEPRHPAALGTRASAGGRPWQEGEAGVRRVMANGLCRASPPLGGCHGTRCVASPPVASGIYQSGDWFSPAALRRQALPCFRVDLTRLQHHRHKRADAIQKPHPVRRRMLGGVGQCSAQRCRPRFTMDAQV